MRLRPTAACVGAVLIAGCASPAAVTTLVEEPPSSTTVPALPSTTVGTVVATTMPSPIVPAEPNPDPVAPSPGQVPADGSSGVAVVAAGGASLVDEPDGEILVRAREGLTLVVTGRDGTWFRLLTPCDTEAWVASSEIVFAPAGDWAGDSLESAVIVLDPGHGGPNRGATGPTGLAEPEVNLDIARRTRDLLEGSHEIDWATGAVLPGETYGPAAAVWLTRTEGPPGADYETGLVFRARLAAAAGAHALISIHNNAEPDGPYAGPGSEAFYSIQDPASKRLAGLVVEEFRRGFLQFDVAWVGDSDAGAKYRLNDTGDDYYGLIRFSEVPVVIAEGAFISSPEEEDLLRTAAFRQAYAEAVYRAVVRFVSTDDPGSGFTEPYPRTIPAGSGAPLATCAVPSQP